MRNAVRFLAIGAVMVACVSAAQAVETQMVPVGNPGNAGELSGEGAEGYGPDRICGAVDYVYSVGKFEVTAGQYTEFLNAVAGDDTYGLYNEKMDFDVYPDDCGCNIQRTGSSPNYTYSVAPDWADRPVNWVSWGDAARFCNWLHNGQPTGAQDLSTTEDGSYFLNGAESDAELFAIRREPHATWVIPSEDEWHKAAYHKNDGVTGNYFDYPTGSDSVPSCIGDGEDIPDPDPGNYATYDLDGGVWGIGPPYYRTEVGEHENSESPYGTFDQGGNVWEWHEGVVYGSYLGLRGGCFSNDTITLLASYRGYIGNPTFEYLCDGFRVAEVSPPSDPPAVPPTPDDTPKNRFLSIDPTTNTTPVAYQAELTESAYFPASVGAKWWVSDPVCTDTDGNAVPPPCTGENVWRSQLVDTAPLPRVWTEEVVQIADREVVPVATYAIRATPDPTAPTPTFSADLVIATIAKPGTKYWADCVGVWDGTQWTAPNGETNMDDVMAAVFYFTDAANKPHRTWVEVDDEDVNMVLNFTDILRIVQGFKGEEYPFDAPSTMVFIPGGEFEMGDHHGVGETDESPVHAVRVDSFHMDIYEVTNRQYAEALNWALAEGLIDNPDLHDGVVYDSGGSTAYCDTTASIPSSRITWDGGKFGVTADKEDHPMVGVSWHGAAAYANWRSAQDGRDPCYDLSTWECDFDANGYRLPTEAEWEYAARGGAHDPYYQYPWGDTADGSNANYSGSGDPYETGGYPWTTPAGYYDGTQTPAGVDMANGYGLYDMSGNAWEWCNDWYGLHYYDSSPYENPPGPVTGTTRVIRSGCWYELPLYCRAANRGAASPEVRLGFRLCSRTPTLPLAP